MPKRRLGRVVPSRGPWRVARPTTRLSSFARLHCKAGCSTERILKLPRACVVLCILHLTMAMGRLLGEFVHREAGAVTPALRQDLQVLLSEEPIGGSVYGSAFPDGRGRNGQFR